MADDQNRPSAIRLGDLEFDPTAREVVVAGRKTLLDSRSCSVFLALAERMGERVSKEELLRVAWPHQLVHENSLAKAISKLRRAIDGSGLEIAVAYGAGYSLRKATRHVSNEAMAKAQDEGPRAVPGPGRSRSSVSLAGWFLASLLAAAAGFLLLKSLYSPDPIRDSPPITNDPPDRVATILWVDDNPSNNRLEVAAFRKKLLAVHLAVTTEDALKLLAMNSYQLVVSDLGRGEDRLAGLRMISAMKRRGIEVPVLIYTVRPKEVEGQQAQRMLVMEAGASDLAVTPQEVRTKVLRRVRPEV